MSENFSEESATIAIEPAITPTTNSPTQTITLIKSVINSLRLILSKVERLVSTVTA
jgi:hypothetical protein